jgi:GntR family transcriptional regulator/MocR family aminotransferase
LTLSASIAAAAGFELQHLAVDDHGADVAALTRADVAYLTPAHQFPMGVSLSADRRTAVTAWARKHDRLVIEDDYDGEYRYDRQPVGALQALDPDHVVYLGTTSKSLAPALRLGWLVAPPKLLRELLEARTLAFGYNSSLDQLTLAELLRTGVYDRLLRSSRARYRRRRQQLVEALRLLSIEVEGAEAGLHALVRLPPGVDEAQVVRRARRSGLAVEGLGQYTLTSGHQRAALVIGFGAATPESYGRCLAVLADVLRTVS